MCVLTLRGTAIKHRLSLIYALFALTHSTATYIKTTAESQQLFRYDKVSLYFSTKCQCTSVQSVTVLQYKVSLYFSAKWQSVTVLQYKVSLYFSAKWHCTSVQSVTVLQYKVSLYFSTKCHCTSVQSFTVLQYKVSLYFSTNPINNLYTE
jgi:hypothetical protein